MASKTTPNTVRMINVMYERGCKPPEIARVLGMSHAAICNILAKRRQAPYLYLIEVGDAAEAYTVNPTADNLNKLVSAGQAARQFVENS